MNRRRRMLCAAMPAASMLAACGTPPASAPARRVVRGSVAWRERIAVPPEAELIVRVLDVSRADAPATVLAEQRQRTGGRQPPFAFELAVDAARLDPRMRCTVAARVELAGRLLFISDTAYPVLTQGAGETADLMLVRVPAR